MPDSSNPETPKLCECGCGLSAPVAAQTIKKLGYVRGEPLRFRKGHNLREYSPVEYVVDESTGCWNWQKAKAHGYGYMYDADGPRRTIEAHRVYYERVNGSIPEGMQIDHLCRNRGCVNPEHMEVVTIKQNVQRGEKSKLSYEKAREIRRLKSEEGLTYKAIAERFGVFHTTIQQVCRNKTWRE